MTPQSRKSIKLNQAALKPTPFPRMTLAIDEIATKESRNTRDKVYKAGCIENVMKFLTENAYEGAFSHKIVGNPSNKEFQSIFKFMYSFIDSTPFLRFEDDVLSSLKLLKYPYCNEITRSQLTAITPHTWPVILSMMSWLADLIRRSDEIEDQTETVESGFYEYVCEGYTKFMSGEEDENLDQEFMKKISMMHSKETIEIEKLQEEVRVMMNELENQKSKFGDLSKLENKKMKINEDLNALIANDKQLELKKAKYISSIEKIVEEISHIESQIDDLIKVKNELIVQINSQTINPQDIKEMNIEKVELFKELERLKPERDALAKSLKLSESRTAEKAYENEKLAAEISSLRNGFNIDCKNFDHTLIVALENELVVKNEGMVNYELTLSSLEEKVREKNSQVKDLEEQYAHMNTKLQTIGSIYLEKKEISERSQQKNRNEVDRLENELLKLKLESDSIYLKSEKDYSEAKIKLDIQNSFISKEHEEIARMVWEFYNGADSLIKTIELIEKDLKKLQR